MSEKLENNNIIQSQLLFKIAGKIYYLLHSDTIIKAGEFKITKGMNYYDIIELLTSNKYYFHSITIPEGLTVKQVMKIMSELGIPGEITSEISEGSLMPETYNYISTDDKHSIIQRMTKDMDIFVSEAWKRNKNPYLKSKEELITFASIVEKETNVDDERAIVASVLTNRLRLRMKLQSDPTIIYEITKGETSFGRKITKSDINFGSVYNTYKIFGLPPKPIACPSKKSILASIEPANTTYLYFVAVGDNSGRHIFSPTYEEHLKNVDKYRMTRLAREMEIANATNTDDLPQ